MTRPTPRTPPDGSGPERLGITLDRPLAFLDLETTGLDPRSDRIVELAVLRIDPSAGSEERCRRFHPEGPIPSEATAVHGISDEDVAGEAPFRARARSLARWLDPCDLAGFNIRRFDLPMLVAEFKRSGVDFDPRTRRIVDVQQIFHREEPRDLTAAARMYLGRDIQDAHSALGDVRTSLDVLAAQLERYSHLPRTMEALHRYCDEVAPFRTELERWLRPDAAGTLTFVRGKHRGRPLSEIATAEPDYLQWMLGMDDLDPEVGEVVQAAIRDSARDPSQEALELP